MSKITLDRVKQDLAIIVGEFPEGHRNPVREYSEEVQTDDGDSMLVPVCIAGQVLARHDLLDAVDQQDQQIRDEGDFDDSMRDSDGNVIEPPSEYVEVWGDAFALDAAWYLDRVQQFADCGHTWADAVSRVENGEVA